MPERIQRKRSKGWRIPPGAVYVGRPTKWGNPFPTAQQYQRWLLAGPMTVDDPRHRILSDIHELRGKTLACWCAPGSPCHADVLLELANRPMLEGESSGSHLLITGRS